ncbi:unnamed protein product [Adineta ricciae]|nr:unnamed protein product [Adineta ricciae]
MPYQILWYWLFSTAISGVELNLKFNIINIGIRYLALTIRNLNYTLNFFLYSLTSIVFLKEAFAIARCNYFLNQRFIQGNPVFSGLRRFFTLPDEQREHQQTHGLINQGNPENELNPNYQTFSKQIKAQRAPIENSNTSHPMNGHCNSYTTKGDVAINLKQLNIKPKQKRIKWNLKPMKQALSSHHLHIPYDDDELHTQVSSNGTSTTNLNESNQRNQE